MGGIGTIYGPYRHAPGFWTYRADAAMGRRVIAVLTPYLSEIKLEQIDAARCHCADMNELQGTRKVPSERTHCPAGHPYDVANTRHYRGTRLCRTCRRVKERAAREVARNGRDPGM